MTEGIYILTILYAIYVIDAAEGQNIVAFVKDFIHIDLSGLHNSYRKFRDSIFKTVSFG